MFKIYILNYGCIYDSARAYDTDRFLQKPKLEMKANSAGSLTFTIAEWMEGYSEIEIFKTIIYVTRRNRNNEETVIWAGRVYEEKRDELNNREVECEGALAFLNDSIQPNTMEITRSFRYIFYAIVSFHNSLMTNDNLKFDVSHFAPGSSYYGYFGKSNKIPEAYEGDDPEGSVKKTNKTSLDVINELFIKKYGGYLKITHSISEENGVQTLINKLDYIDAYDEEMNPVVSQPIQFGENLISLERTATADDFGTVIYPIGDSLEDYDKAWTMYEHISNDYVRYYDRSPESFIDYHYISGHRIDSDNGALVPISDSRYCMIQFIPVKPDDRFFLTTYMLGVPLSYSSDGKTMLGAAAYCIHKSDMATPVTIGEVAKNTTTEEDGVKTEIVNDVDLFLTEIKIPEEGAYLSVAVFDPNNRERPFELRKFNPYYAETNYSIMEESVHSPSSESPFEKSESYKYRHDTYPSETYEPNHPKNLEIYEKYFRSRIVKHTELVEEFGIILKTITIEGANHENINTEFLYNQAKTALSRMTEKIEIRIKALDLSYLTDIYDPFDFLDMVHALSEPHHLDVSLPILEMTIPLDSPEEAEYTIENEVETRDGEPSYMTVYMSDMYKKGKS